MFIIQNYRQTRISWIFRDVFGKSHSSHNVRLKLKYFQNAFLKIFLTHCFGFKTFYSWRNWAFSYKYLWNAFRKLLFWLKNVLLKSNRKSFEIVPGNILYIIVYSVVPRLFVPWSCQLWHRIFWIPTRIDWLPRNDGYSKTFRRRR